MNILICLAGVFVILVTHEFLRRKKLLKPEFRRKFVHASVGTFIAFWPWLLSWNTIQILGAAMLLGVLVNRKYKLIHFNDPRKGDYGDILFAAVIIVCAMLTDVRIFFAIAMLQMSIADTLAALVGKSVRRTWQYFVFGQPKTVIGSMTFWTTSLIIFGIGGLLAHGTIPFEHYPILLLAAPPALTFLEAVSVKGTDKFTVPLATIIALNLVS